MTSKCGMMLVYDDGEMEEQDVEEEQDVALGYYKSWNHIIGGDLSAFQTTTGEYILKGGQFMRHKISPHLVIMDSASYKEEEVAFIAFSRSKSSILDHASQKTYY